MPRLKAANNAQTTLAASCTATDTVITVTDVSKFPNPPFRITIDAEIMEVTNVDVVNKRFTVQRGLEGTTAAAHSAGATVENRFTAGTYDELVDITKFDATTGHKHTGVAGDAPPIPLSGIDAAAKTTPGGTEANRLAQTDASGRVGDSKKLGGYNASDYPRKAENATISGTWTFNSNVTANRLATKISGDRPLSANGPSRYVIPHPNKVINPSGEIGTEGWTLVSGTMPVSNHEAETGRQFESWSAFEWYTDVYIYRRTQNYYFTMDIHRGQNDLEYKLELLDNSKNLLATPIDWKVAGTNTVVESLDGKPWSLAETGGYLRIRIRSTNTNLKRWRNVGLWHGYPGIATGPHTDAVKWLYDNTVKNTDKTTPGGTEPNKVAVTGSNGRVGDANKLGGYNASDYPRKGENASVTATWTFTDNVIHHSSNNSRHFYFTRFGSTNNEFLRVGVADDGPILYAKQDEATCRIKFDLEATDTESGGGANANSGSIIFETTKTGGRKILIDNNQVWHAGNDGSGSGLDADLLDGYQTTSPGGTEATRVAVTNSSGRVGDSEKLGGYASSSYPRKDENATITGAWTKANNLTFDAAAAERRLQWNLGSTYGNIGFFGRPSDGQVGLFDWKNNRTVMKYDPATNTAQFGSPVTTDIVRGLSDPNVISLGTSGPSVDMSSGVARWRQSSAHYIRQWSNGVVDIVIDGSVKHQFKADGTKVGGTIEIDGQIYGMSPVDSPRVLIKDVLFDVYVSETETVVNLDPTFAKAINGYAVFPSRGDVQVISKTSTSFTVIGPPGGATVDFVVIGKRVGYENTYWMPIETPSQ